MSLNTDILITIFAIGFIAGIFFGISLAMGEDVSPESLLIKTGYMICDALKSVNPNASNECRSYIFFASAIIIIAGTVDLILYIFRSGNLVIGVLTYIFGFVFGVGVVLYSI